MVTVVCDRKVCSVDNIIIVVYQWCGLFGVFQNVANLGAVVTLLEAVVFVKFNLYCILSDN